MAISDEFLRYVLEQLAGLDQVRTRRMFGGIGLYCGEAFFGLIAADTLYFKVDDSNRGDYERHGATPFRPYRDRPDASMSYYAVPADALEDAPECELWARRAIAIARAAPPRRRRKRAGRALGG